MIKPLCDTDSRGEYAYTVEKKERKHRCRLSEVLKRGWFAGMIKTKAQYSEIPYPLQRLLELRLEILSPIYRRKNQAGS